ncbi:Chemotaxis protein methyltransferase [Stieleria bergensis]|uniref:Probable chemoreceptor glutamine deamidase CheD n=1 Tax=Stieleria bergensis TaxID=2528025 RepID=A0A517SZM9_9BACT|nr:Chemotaxis protein methyltransferase [Planctomycetes bacterium SV_7m_r]
MSEPTLSEKEFQLIRDLIYKASGINLQEGKQVMMQSRLRKRLRALNLTSYQAYYKHVTQNDPDGKEMVELINSISTNKTEFFRENHHFDFLKSTLFPQMIRDAKAGKAPRKLRIWSAACSTGQEPYSIAVTIREAFAKEFSWDFKILASDIDTNVLQHAEQGIYNPHQVIGLSKYVTSRYFQTLEDGDKIQAKPELREMIAFRRINFMDDQWPVNAKFDVIFCRNVMIYFDNSTQERLLKRFSQYQDPGKNLILGHSESLTPVGNLYQTCGKTTFIRTEVNASQSPPAQAPVAAQPGQNAPTASPARPTVSSRATTRSAAPPPTSGQLSASRQAANRRAARNANQTAAGPKKIAADVAAHLDEHTRITANGNLSTCTVKHSIIVGEVKAANTPVWITTLLGSCIAACLYDEKVNVGGMNHFLLPDGAGTRNCSSYGIHAMELLINEIMSLGGERSRLKAKVFGGGNVVKGMRRTNSIGQRNTEFIKEFLRVESIPIESELLGCDSGLMVQFFPMSGRARVRPVESKAINMKEEETFRVPVLADVPHQNEASDDNITLF